MDSVDILLTIALGWFALALLGYVLVLPLLASGARADRLQERLGSVPDSRFRRSGRFTNGATPSAPVLRSPAEAGYAGIVLDRLIHHACVVLGMGEGVLAASMGDQLVVVGGHGVDADLVGGPVAGGSRLLDAAFAPSGPVAGGRGAQLLARAGLPAYGCAPVTAGGEARGLLAVGRPGAEPGLTGPELELLGEIASLAGVALHHRDSRELPYSDPRQEIAGLVGALQAADDQTESHSHVVAALAYRAGQELGLTPADLFELELAARLHDVGKIRVPPAILGKPGSLTEHEIEIMRLHPMWGAEIVAGIPGLQAVALLVRLHHERLDGRGYPVGLPGERIPLASRIVSACDAYGAMIDDRPYRTGLRPEESIAELRRCAGTQFDPAVVEALDRALDRAPALAGATA
jgi:HD-GYP domain-containing protein (c-di-GMP phosphodiesterase class II)